MTDRFLPPLPLLPALLLALFALTWLSADPALAQSGAPSRGVVPETAPALPAAQSSAVRLDFTVNVPVLVGLLGAVAGVIWKVGRWEATLETIQATLRQLQEALERHVESDDEQFHRLRNLVNEGATGRAVQDERLRQVTDRVSRLETPAPRQHAGGRA